MDIVQQLGTALGLGLLSGVRLYLTVLAIGAAIRFQWLHLSESYAGLDVLADWRVMTLAGIACAIEFVADKVPWIDSAWDSLHTFIRPIGAVLLGASAFSTADPALRAMLMILCGSVALTGHSAKSATRLLVNHSPEPVSNIALSLAGDAFVPLATWFTFQYPVITLVFVVTFAAITWWLSPRIFRLMRVELATVGAAVSSWFGTREELPKALVDASLPANTPELGSAVQPLRRHMRPLPSAIIDALERRQYKTAGLGVHCAADRGVKGLRSSIGYLTATPDRLVFVTRRWFRYRYFEIPIPGITKADWRSHIMADTFSLVADGKPCDFDVFRPRTVVVPVAVHAAAAAEN
jgi:hypothetical protein